MINPNDCYCEFSSKSEFIWDYCQSILTHKNIEKIKWPEYASWDFISISVEKLNQEPILKKINEKHKIKLIGILRTRPYSNYIWHKDLTRGLTINMLLSLDHDSHCLFGKGETAVESKIYSSGGMELASNNIIYFNELEYKPKTFYLFNTQQLHTQYNFGKMRYLFTVEFLEDANSLSYEDVFGWMRDEDLLILGG